MDNPKRTSILAVAILLLVAAGVMALVRRSNPHLESLISDDPVTGCLDDDFRRGELEAAGADAVPFLREQLRLEPGLAIQATDWLASKGAVIWVNDWISETLARSIRRRLDDRNRIQAQAVRALLLLGPAAIEARPELERLLQDPIPSLRALAFVAIAAQSPFDPATVSNSVAALGGNDESRRSFLTRDFPLAWKEAPTHLDALIPLLKDRNEDIRANAARALAHYGPTASNAIPQLVELLNAPGRRAHPSAAYALGLVSADHADLAVAAMLGQQQTNNSWTGGIAYRLYAALGPAARRAEPALRHELTRTIAQGFSGPPAFALWRVTGEASPEIISGLSRGATQGIQRFQVMSLRGLREIGPPASNAIPVLRQLKNARHRALQRLADEALQSITAPTPAAMASP